MGNAVAPLHCWVRFARAWCQEQSPDSRTGPLHTHPQLHSHQLPPFTGPHHGNCSALDCTPFSSPKAGLLAPERSPSPSGRCWQSRQVGGVVGKVQPSHPSRAPVHRGWGQRAGGLSGPTRSGNGLFCAEGNAQSCSALFLHPGVQLCVDTQHRSHSASVTCSSTGWETPSRPSLAAQEYK